MRVDRDTIRRRGAIARVLRDVARGAIDILVGTQMIAKGHDFPAVTLVGVVSADVGLGLADFRASERTFQLLTQVVGRAGRGETPGEAIIQTLYPDHYAIRAAAAQDYDTFFEREMRVPPRAALSARASRSSTSSSRAARSRPRMGDAQDLVTRVRRHGGHGKVLGPGARRRWRRSATSTARSSSSRARTAAPCATRLTRALDERSDLKRKVIVDVDPVHSTLVMGNGAMRQCRLCGCCR